MSAKLETPPESRILACSKRITLGWLGIINSFSSYIVVKTNRNRTKTSECLDPSSTVNNIFCGTILFYYLTVIWRVVAR